MTWTRVQVEQLGKNGVQSIGHPSGPQCRILSTFWQICDPSDRGYTPHAIADGYWESWITSWFVRQLNEQPDAIVIDVGANMGYYSLLSASLGHDSIAIEPQPHLAERLRSSKAVNALADARFVVLEYAVGATAGCADLHVPTGHGMNAGFTAGFSPEGTYTSYTVAVQPLDQIIAAYVGKRVAPLVIKIDAEGAEPLVWDGMQRTWRDYAGPLTVVMEYRWDRYKDPIAFARALFDQATVSYVDYNGIEQALTAPANLAIQQHEDWMLVLRRL